MGHDFWIFYILKIIRSRKSSPDYWFVLKKHIFPLFSPAPVDNAATSDVSKTCLAQSFPVKHLLDLWMQLHPPVAIQATETCSRQRVLCSVFSRRRRQISHPRLAVSVHYALLSSLTLFESSGEYWNIHQRIPSKDRIPFVLEMPIPVSDIPKCCCFDIETQDFNKYPLL